MDEPIPHIAEVDLKYHDRRCAETFEETSRPDAHFDKSKISLSLNRPDSTEAHRLASRHFDCALFAEILSDLVNTTASVHRQSLREGAKLLCLALYTGPPGPPCEEELTPDLEVRLLHILE